MNNALGVFYFRFWRQTNRQRRYVFDWIRLVPARCRKCKTGNVTWPVSTQTLRARRVFDNNFPVKIIIRRQTCFYAYCTFAHIHVYIFYINLWYQRRLHLFFGECIFVSIYEMEQPTRAYTSHSNFIYVQRSRSGDVGSSELFEMYDLSSIDMCVLHVQFDNLGKQSG